MGAIHKHVLYLSLPDLMDEVTYRITVAAFRTQNDRSEDLLFSTELFYPCDDSKLIGLHGQLLIP